MNILFFINLFINLFKKDYYGFLTNNFEDIDILSSDNTDVKKETCESNFAKLIGTGKSLSFASGRMALYVLLKVFNIKDGDDVLILGFTCSVVVNAVLKTGASPIYYDLDIETCGSSIENIMNSITKKTKCIIVQHTFGIPCNIQPIIKYTKENNIILIEDCALSFGSSIDGIKVGDFGDASIFSTDHTKPINSYTGGFIYTKSDFIFKEALIIQQNTKHIPNKLIYRFIKQFNTEIRYSNNYNILSIKNYFTNIYVNKILKKSTYLNEDYTSVIKNNVRYPYPAKMPLIFFNLICKQLNRWDKISIQRVEIFNIYLDYFNKNNLNDLLPKVYLNRDIKIIPLRFVFYYPKNKELLMHLSKLLDISSFWFTRPIIATKESLLNYNYKKGTCINSETYGDRIINFPCCISKEKAKKIITHFDLYITNYKKL